MSWVAGLTKKNMHEKKSIKVDIRQAETSEGT